MAELRDALPGAEREPQLECALDFDPHKMACLLLVSAIDFEPIETSVERIDAADVC